MLSKSFSHAISESLCTFYILFYIHLRGIKVFKKRDVFIATNEKDEKHERSWLLLKGFQVLCPEPMTKLYKNRLTIIYKIVNSKCCIKDQLAIGQLKKVWKSE